MRGLARKSLGEGVKVIKENKNKNKNILQVMINLEQVKAAIHKGKTIWSHDSDIDY